MPLQSCQRGYRFVSLSKYIIIKENLKDDTPEATCFAIATIIFSFSLVVFGVGLFAEIVALRSNKEYPTHNGRKLRMLYHLFVSSLLLLFSIKTISK